MRRAAFVLMCFTLLLFTSSASADWRWAAPKLKPHKATYSCATYKCIRSTYIKERHRLHRRLVRYNKRRLTEWNHWAHLYIPTCTWYGESGSGPQFASYRYTLPNSTGSGAYGKYQMMSGTYHTFDKYGDWSPLDQEIAGHRLYWNQGTGPWQAC